MRKASHNSDYLESTPLESLPCALAFFFLLLGAMVTNSLNFAKETSRDPDIPNEGLITNPVLVRITLWA